MRHSVRRRALLVSLVAAVATVTLLAVPQAGAGAQQPLDKPHKKVCHASAKQAECHAEVVTKSDGVTPDASTTRPSGAYGPTELKSAYALPGGTAGSGKTVAVVDAYDNPNAESDLTAYRNSFGLSACTTANGCFRKVNQSGAASPLPSGDLGWGQEIDLDLQSASATCPACKLLLVEASSTSYDDLGVAEDTAARLGASAISNSWGGNEFNGVLNYDSHFNHPGVAITASTGDDGYQNPPQYPSTSQHVTGVGGTSLTRSSSTRGWAETAWSGAGSGCSRYVAKPTWQKDTGCANRTVSDVSAVADPSTGFAVYDSYGSSGGANWYQFGGTSLASPIIAASFVMGGATAPSYPYAHTSNLNDVVSGSSGSCGTYVCNAVSGYDGPTGLGTPKGLGAFGAVATTTTTTSATTTTKPPATTTTTTAATTTTTTAATTTTTKPPATTTTTKPPVTTTTTRPPTTTTTVPGTPPSAPQSAHVTSQAGGITVCWSAPASVGSGPILSYKIYRGDWGAETYLATVSGSTLCFQDTSVPMWTYYYYRVTAVNAAGEGPPSNNTGALRNA